MLFAIDIDGVLANSYQAFMNYYNKDLGLGLTVDIIAQCADYEQLFALPQVQSYPSYRQNVYESHQRARVIPEIYLDCVAFPASQEGVRLLTTHGRIGYYTVRAPHLHDVTAQWLSSQHFPLADVTCCKNILRKYAALYMATKETQEPIVLIDDRYEQLFVAWRGLETQLPAVAESLRHRFLLVAFGAPHTLVAPDDICFPVVALPDWSHGETILPPLISHFSPVSVNIKGGSL